MSAAKGDLVDYEGGRRLVAGRTRYRTPVEPGTIVGPKDTTREMLVALSTTEDGWTLFGYATPADLLAVAGHDPRSQAEAIRNRNGWIVSQRGVAS